MRKNLWVECENGHKVNKFAIVEGNRCLFCIHPEEVVPPISLLRDMEVGDGVYYEAKETNKVSGKAAYLKRHENLHFKTCYGCIIRVK